VSEWSFLTNHGRALLLIARDPNTRLRDLAVALDVTERTAYGIVLDLTKGGYIAKERDGRRNRYHIQADLHLPDSLGKQRAIGEFVDLFINSNGR
jgi:DNA-binding IclR family transcriptional regulator